jgi:hypothetical protein
MPILVKCDCGHEITVADSMEGKKGRCPQCDAVLSIPSKPGRRRRGGAFSRPPREPVVRSYGGLSNFATLLTLLGLLSLLAFAGIGVYTGVTAFRGPDSFHGPFGLFSEYAAAARENPTWIGIAFIVGGLLLGGLAALVLTAVGQGLKLLLSLEEKLARLLEDRA